MFCSKRKLNKIRELDKRRGDIKMKQQSKIAYILDAY